MNAQLNERPRGRGFASMDAAKQRSIASRGGRAAHEQARAAGRKGGEVVSANRAHMAAIGRKGGEASHRGASKSSAVSEIKQVERAPTVTMVANDAVSE
jgi:general stress protein YciG